MIRYLKDHKQKREGVINNLLTSIKFEIRLGVLG